ncbi:hypothetical protein [Maridesulfovibrio sp. FT414]|uniref:hypothetical protein n=1 Tax=Maridesulfovibrio sp. FT414 TaxID=2979469 RepID=UPI003D80593C
MLSTFISPVQLEKAVLHFLAIALAAPAENHPCIPVPGGDVTLVFHGLDIVQERGRLPLLVLDFDCGKFRLQVEFFGHLAPAKFHCARLYDGDEVVAEHLFADPGTVYRSELAGEMEAAFPDSADAGALMGSLYLWRSCAGLSCVCPEELGKYFGKMKSVSRYVWELLKAEYTNDAVVEKWITSDYTCASDSAGVSVVLENGVVVNVNM